MITLPGYQIKEILHQNQRSSIYRALREEDRQPVVLKVLGEAFPTAEELARFRLEYEMAKALNLAGVVNVYDLVKYQNTLVIVMEDFGGESLAKLISSPERAKTSLAWVDFLPLAIRVTTILGQIHDARIIHKDINPSNILFNPTTGVVKVIDFGISTRLSSERVSARNPNAVSGDEMMEGTLAYISPEQTGRINRWLDYRSDFYSLGVTFYELLTAQLPFSTTDRMALVHAHLAKEPLPPHQLKADIPAVLSAIVMKLLAKTAEERYQSAEGLKVDLETCLVQWQSKGKVDLFPLAQHDQSSRFQIPGQLYGRAQEISRLLAAFERVCQGEPEMMLVSGYSGIGKSMLVHEIQPQLVAQKGYFITGKFDQFQRNIPYSAPRQAFGELMQSLLTESDSDIARWREKLLTALGVNGQLISRLIPEVELIVGRQPDLPALPPTEEQNRFNHVFEDFVSVFTDEAPLVIFLDDLQWADSASLKLIEHLMTASNSRHLFLIGAYRDNEVSAAHPLMLTLDGIQEKSVTIKRISLTSLAAADVNQLIADTLHCTPQASEALAHLLLHKTNGNPFFVKQFLSSLYDAQLITFNSQLRRWQWEMLKIEAPEMMRHASVANNVVELMVGKLQKLPPETQQALQLAACIGNQFDLSTLSIVSQRPQAEIAANLWPAAQEGLILPIGERYKFFQYNEEQANLSDELQTSYKFLHDRVQQAAYLLIPEERKREVHLQIGRLMLASHDEEVQREALFEIVNHLNFARTLIDRQAEKEELAALNLRAGQKAKAATAYQPAFTYFSTGIDLLGANRWRQEEAKRELTMALHVEAAEAAYLKLDFEEMERLAEIVLAEARTTVEKVRIYEAKIQSYIAQHKLLEAVETAREILALLGISLPQSPEPTHIGEGLAQTEAMLAGREILALQALPPMTEPEKLAALRILMTATSPVYWTKPLMFPLISFQMVQLSAQYGNASYSAYGYGTYGVLLCAAFGNINRGYEFGRLSIGLVEQLRANDLKAKVYMVFNCSVKHWKDHTKTTLKGLQSAYQSGLESGDFEYAAQAIAVYCAYSFLTGKELSELERECADYALALHNLNQIFSWHVVSLFQQLALNLMGHAEVPYQLVGESLDESTLLPKLEQANDHAMICMTHIYKSMLCYLFDQHEEALKSAKIARDGIGALVGTAYTTSHNFYYSLILLAGYPEAEEEEQKQIMATVDANQEQLKGWAEHAPSNYQHNYDLVAAERARLLGQVLEAMDYYDKAIAGAHQNDYLNEEALANELAVNFYLSRGQEKIARAYLLDARHAYEIWGATAKIKHLEARYPALAGSYVRRGSLIAEQNTTTTGSTHSGGFDLAAVMKAAQAISGELVLNHLLSRLMQIMIENAGAQKGFLILSNDEPSDGEQWVIEATLRDNQIEVSGLQAMTIEASEQFSPAIINYVARTKQDVVLNDASQEGIFTQDPYIRKEQPKSILCLPLIHQGKVIALLYLENNLTSGAFTPSRLELLKLLAAQAAISLENATLYNTLEQKVVERTHEATEARLVAEKANQAKSTFLANMSHELRTPLNAILGFADIMKHQGEGNHRHLDIISRSGEHLLTLINSILNLSKIEAGKMSLNANNFDLLRLLDELEAMFQLQAKDQGLQLSVEYAPDLPRYVRTDAVKLRQVLINLLSNAIKYTEEGGVSLYMSQSPAGQLHVEVRDSGVGIAAEELENLFEAFTQTEAGKYKQEGTGLGLPISQQFVQLMGGQIIAESEVGFGTRFIFDIDIEEVDPLKEEPATRRVIALAPNQPRYRILIVDDKQDNRQLLLNLLKPLGFDVAEASNGQEAIERWHNWQPSLIWMDIRMPVMDGYEATRHIKKSSKGESCPIIALTASIYEEEQVTIWEAGFDDFLRKPFRPTQIFDLMSKHLGVRYLYEDSPAPIAPSPRRSIAQSQNRPLAVSPPRKRSLANSLSTLPPERRQALYQATIQLNLRQTLAQIAQIRPYDEPLADALTELAHQFQFEKLASLLKEV